MNGRTARLIRAAARVAATDHGPIMSGHNGSVAWPKNSYRAKVQRLKRQYLRLGNDYDRWLMHQFMSGVQSTPLA
jgi:hypothetical protein